MRKFFHREQLTESQKDKKQRETKANIYETWVETNQLLDSAICISDEEYVKIVIADKMYAVAPLTEGKILQELKDEDS